MEKILPQLRATCSSCKFYDEEGQKRGQGICRRYPPIATALALPQQNALTQQVQVSVQTMSSFPTTPAGGWCGEMVQRLHAQH